MNTMNSTPDSSPQVNDLPATFLAAQSVLISQIHELLRTAAQSLGMDEGQAQQTAHSGGVLLDGTTVLVTAVALEPIESSRLVISAGLGRNLSDTSTAGLMAVLVQGAALLAVHEFAIGSDPDGELTLYRSRNPNSTTSDDLVTDMLALRQMVALLQDATREEGQ